MRDEIYLRSKRGNRKADSTQVICHFHFGTSNKSAILNSCNIFKTHKFIGNGRSFDAEQLNDTERLKSAATHNPLASKSPLVLADLRKCQIKSLKNGI